MVHDDTSSLPDAIATTWAASLIDTQEQIDPGRTLRPPESLDSRADTIDELDVPQIALTGRGGDFELRGSLGEGGMAVVECAWQRSLDREVAIKQARDPHSHARTRMIREARIAGSLEHPNIVPVHALGRDEHGNAVIVMKRVAGVSWEALLRDPEHPLWGEGDRLLRNLDILSQVCRALELAHVRGWLHRDLKSENVMIGEFGEVYVLDWGIAVPLVMASRGEAVFAGTPACMAPEMAAMGALTERTDVYLLGGLLHEILTGGAMLHEGHNLQALIFSAMMPRVRTYPSELPPEIIAIAARATEYEPEDRYPDVASFRRALSSFVVHRNALELAERACARLDALDGFAEADRRSELLDARAGLRQSLSLWSDPGNVSAHSGLDRCLRGLIELELAEASPSAAAGWAAQLTPRDPAFETRIDGASRDVANRARELRTLRLWAADRDVAHSAKMRSRRAFALAGVLAVLGLGLGQAERLAWFELGYPQLFMAQALVSGIAIGAVLSTHRRLNRVGRWMGHVMILAALFVFPILGTAWGLGLPAEATFTLDALVMAGGATVIGALVDRRLYGVAVTLLATTAALLAFPSTVAIEVFAGGLVVAHVFAAIALRVRPPQGPLDTDEPEPDSGS